MNLMLGSPLEALAFNYVSFGIFTVVNNLWTWVAVITAAVSFCTIRAAGGATTLSCSVTKTDQKPPTCIIDRAEAEEKPSHLALVSAPASVAETSVSPLDCSDGATKGGKFRLTVYYEDDGDSDGDDGEMTVTEWAGGDGDCKGGSCGDWWESWERVLRMRKGETETGWYRCLDLTAINGNVVRLWEESCRRGRYS
ncbi:hypothetical protein PTKIN_Ptkin03bG0221200 [Pterospermum kingtungense]